MKAIKSVALAMLALGILSTSGCDRHSNKEVFYLIATNGRGAVQGDSQGGWP